VVEMELKELIKIVLLVIAGFIIGYIFRQEYAFHHHPPWFSKVIGTRYKSGEMVWEEE